MKQQITLLLAAAALCGLSTNAQTPAAVTPMPAPQAQQMHARTSYTVVQTDVLSNGLTAETRRDAKGHVYTVYPDMRHNGANSLKLRKTVTPDGRTVMAWAPSSAPTQKADVQHRRAAGDAFSEGFEGYPKDGSTNWLPEGWSNVSKTSDEGRQFAQMLKIVLGWRVIEDADAPEGDCSLSASMQIKPQEEWCVLPPITVQNGYQLTYSAEYAKCNFISLDNWNSSTDTFNGGPKAATDVKVMASTDGGQTWQQLKSYFDDVVANMTSYSELQASETVDGWATASWHEGETVDLSSLAGQEVTLAFEIVGERGQGFTIDNLSIATAPTPETTLVESFEGYPKDGSKNWLPEGWSNVSKTSDEGRQFADMLKIVLGWRVIEDADAPDGDCSLSASMQIKPQEEWCVLPPVKIYDGYEMRYAAEYAKCNFISLDNWNSSTDTFTDGPKAATDIKVMASTDGGQTWQQLKSYFDDVVANMTSYSELQASETVDGWATASWHEGETVDLSSLAGQEVTLAFEIVGERGQGFTIDNLTIGVAPAPETTLEESFETYPKDGSKNWLPEGWANVSKTSDDTKSFAAMVGFTLGWHAMADSDAPDGDCTLNASLQIKPQDEWCVLPAVKVYDGYQLTYAAEYAKCNFISLDNWNGSTDTFNGGPKAATDIKVMASTDGGQTWQQLKSYFDDVVAGMTSYLDLQKSETGSDGFATASWHGGECIDLSAFAGQEVTLAFEIVGERGQSFSIDDVRIGLTKPLSNFEEDVTYMGPGYELFFGIDKDGNTANTPIAIVPVNQPVTWTKATPEGDDVRFSWTYSNLPGQTFTAEGDSISIAYQPDYTSEKTCINNWYDLPELTASKDQYYDAKGTSKYNYVQAGGNGLYFDEPTDKKYEMGMLPYCPYTEGHVYLQTPTTEKGSAFGYDQYSDAFWTKQLTGKDTIDDQNYAHIAYIFNAYPTTERPVVITGATLRGLGDIKPEAQFTLDILPVNADGTYMDAEGNLTVTPFATATATGDAIVTHGDKSGDYKWYQIEFKLDSAAVISAEDCPMYIVRIGGFRDAENVTYFAPFESAENLMIGTNRGFVQHDVMIEGKRQATLTSMVSCRWLNSAFCIVTDAAYPWLTSEVEEVALNDDETVTVPLGSYYDGKDLKVLDAPQWLHATIEGRYDKAVLKLSKEPTSKGQAVIHVTAPGVEKALTLTATSGIDDALLDGRVIEGYYDLQGRRLGTNPVQGAYLIRYSDGTAVKAVGR